MDGKINQRLFEHIFGDKLGYSRISIKTPPAFGVDVSIVDIGNNQEMALTSDPLSLIPSLGLQESAWLSVHLMANDMATTGKAPQFVQFVLNLPPTLSEQDLKTYWSYIDQYCNEIQLSITGGHTGSIEGQNSTIAGGGTLITVAPKGELLNSAQARTGDVLIMTKSCALSSAAILGLSFPETISNKAGKESAAKAEQLFYQTSSLKEGLLAASMNKSEFVVSAMHDVTEGGVLGAVYEMATAANKGVIIEEDQLSIEPMVANIFNIFDLNPHYCIGAGSMLIAIQAEQAQKLIHLLNENEITASVIGEFLPREKGIKKMNSQGKIEPIDYAEKDPYWGAFFQAIKKGWK